MFVKSVQFSCSVVSDPLRPHGLQHARLPCPSPTPGACSNLWCRWCHPTISFSVVPFSSYLQSFPASGSFPVSQFFASGGQSIGASASALVPPMNIHLLNKLVNSLLPETATNKQNNNNKLVRFIAQGVLTEEIVTKRIPQNPLFIYFFHQGAYFTNLYF